MRIRLRKANLTRTYSPSIFFSNLEWEIIETKYSTVRTDNYWTDLTTLRNFIVSEGV